MPGSDIYALAPAAGVAAVPWRGWEALVVWVIATATGVLVSLAASLVLRGDALTVFSTLAIEVPLGLWVLAWVRIRYRLGARALGWRTDEIAGDVRSGIGAGLAGLALQFVLLPLTLFFAERIAGHAVRPPKQIPLAHPSGLALALTGVAVVVVAPAAEELFFRGFLYQSFRRRLRVASAALASAAVFALLHVYPLLYLPIGALGYLLARTFERRRSILANMVGHAVFNAVGFTVIVLGLR